MRYIPTFMLIMFVKMLAFFNGYNVIIKDCSKTIDNEGICDVD